MPTPMVKFLIKQIKTDKVIRIYNQLFSHCDVIFCVFFLAGSRIIFESVQQVERGWGSRRGSAVHRPHTSTWRSVRNILQTFTQQESHHVHRLLASARKHTHTLNLTEICWCVFSLSAAVRVLPVGGVMSPPVAAVAPVTTGRYQV